jgi:hypothetical protein
MKDMLEFIASYPVWVKLLVVLLGATIVLLLVLFRQPPGTSAKSAPDRESLPEPSIEIEGPPRAVLGRTTYYTVYSQNAVRGVWSIGGFQNDPVEVNPLGPSHQIFVEPTDATRIGDNFAIVFTAYDTHGRTVTAKKRFMVAAE